ncbi:MAG: shikimate dehydrogenase [Alphaproteobacteria bacterium]|nr:shikimate dehydrogenase [Alphaproteobacteria bacterium]
MTTLTGLIGYPVAHSLSPRIHAYWLAQHGINGDYKLFTTPPARVRQIVKRLRDKGAAGFNVTVPHKCTVMEYLDAVDVVATRIGAVNTVTRVKEKLVGSNTDAYGFITHLRAGLTGKPEGDITAFLQNIVLLGAGGATRAAIVALKEAGAQKITLCNRSAEKAQALAAAFSLRTTDWESRAAALAEATLLVNTTSLGMAEQPPLDIDLTYLPMTSAVYDIVYAPLETPLLKAARARGNITVDGLGMLLYQAQAAFQAWHGVLPAVTPALRAHVLEV